MKNYFVLALLFISLFSSSQNSNEFEAVDKKIDEMPDNLKTSIPSITKFITDNFTSNDDKIRAAFYWTTSNISYDVENMFNQKPQTPEEKIAATLNSKKGVCMHYAEVFYTIMNALGNKTILVDGYTKQNGKVAELSHVWCASKINNVWFLFDATWASGSVKDGVFYKKTNNIFFKTEPKNLIGSHMPFDYLWQFSDYPITNQEFYDGKIVSTNTATKFDFLKEIEMLNNLSEAEKSIACTNRIKKSGIKNKLISDRVNFENERTEFHNQKNSIVKVEEIVANFNEANTLLNEFIKYRNNRFIPLVSDEEIKSKVQTPYNMLLKCQSDLNAIKDIKRENTANINSLKKALADSKSLFENHLNFVIDYLAKDTENRQKTFVKTIVRKKLK